MGEIQVRGPFITGSYHEVPVTEDKFTADGWLRTGDVASVDELGFVRITDRTKDLIKSRRRMDQQRGCGKRADEPPGGGRGRRGRHP
jgi:acyl-CoA synthetase (AMP-forming)/AMP-acid ligase II